MKQLSFALAAYAAKKKTMRRERFLSEMQSSDAQLYRFSALTRKD